MSSFYKRNLINDRTGYSGLKGSNFFKLLAILCLVYMLYPADFNKKHSSQAVEELGIGGGIFLDEELSLSEEMPAESLETVTAKPESFSNTRTLLYTFHTMRTGDNISSLAINYGLNQDSIVSINKISNSRLLQVGRILKIPNQDGIIHTVRTGENLTAIATRYKVDKEAIKFANELFSEKVVNGTDLFIPGARLEWTRLQEINGDLFVWPLRGSITSGYGNRRNPFNRSQWQFHNGIDIRGRTGTPVRAAMAGRVSSVGFDRIHGNYVIINHHSGYRTLYGHLSVIRTRTGAYVGQGERIGDVGNTGLSTGPHLHFTIFKNGVTINPRSMLR